MTSARLASLVTLSAALERLHGGPRLPPGERPVAQAFKEQPPEGWTQASPSDAAPERELVDRFSRSVARRARAAGRGIESDGAPELRYLSASGRRSQSRPGAIVSRPRSHRLGHPPGRSRLHRDGCLDDDRRHHDGYRHGNGYRRHDHGHDDHHRRGQHRAQRPGDIGDARRDRDLDAGRVGTGPPAGRGELRDRAGR